MADDFADELAREIPSWVDEGIIDEAQAERILARYEVPSPGSSEETDRTRSALYATAAVLFGAAAIALVFVGIDPDTVQPYLAATGAGFVAAGIGLLRLAPERGLLADALLAAALAPLAVATFDPDVSTATTWAYGLPTLGLAAGYLGWRREQPFLPTLSVIAFAAAAGGTLFNAIADTGTAAFVWALVQLGLVVGLVAGPRLRGVSRLGTTPVALAAAALAVSLIPFLSETMNMGEEILQIVLGAVMALVLAAGIRLEDRGLVVGAAVALCVDAITFAFTVGGVWLGTGLLVALALVLIWQAEHLRGWMEDVEPLT